MERRVAADEYLIAGAVDHDLVDLGPRVLRSIQTVSRLLQLLDPAVLAHPQLRVMSLDRV